MRRADYAERIGTGLAVTLLFVAGCDTAPTAAPSDSLRWPPMVSPDIVESASDWGLGDVFVGVSNGTYQVYDNTGVFREAISDGLGGFTTGCAFNPPFNKLYTTNFGNTKVVVYDVVHPHNVLQIIDTGATSPNGHSESVVFDAAGNFYVGHPDGNDQIHRYDAAGNLLATFSPTIERRGTDWLDLAADQKTMYYTSEGGRIMRFDVATSAQLPDFASIGGISYALRLLPPGDGTGGLLVANTTDVKRLDGSGAVIQTYDVSGENSWFSLNLDPNGRSFWAGNFNTSNFYRFSIATGAVEVGPINTGTGAGTLFGICLKPEATAAVLQILDVDIKPGSDPNCTNDNSKGKIPVGILSESDVELADIDVSTVEIDDDADTSTPGVAPIRWALDKDVSGDGEPDLVLHFQSQELKESGLLLDSNTLFVTGALMDGRRVLGSDVIYLAGGPNCF